MIQRTNKNEIRGRIHQRIRRKVRGTAERPRLAVFRSLSHIYAQLIDDTKSQTLVAAASTEEGLDNVAVAAPPAAAVKAESPKAEKTDKADKGESAEKREKGEKAEKKGGKKAAPPAAAAAPPAVAKAAPAGPPAKARGGNVAGARLIGKTIADRAKEKGIKSVVFDRGGYIYHGRVKALADAAREAGLEF
jgi:large subunit ribosomal protein L18